MKPERKKALISISITLVIGILIGALTVGLLGRNAQSRQRAGWQKDDKEKFVEMILNVVEADAEQAKQMRPLIYEAMGKVDSLQKKTNYDVESVLGAFEIKVSSILSEKQREQLRQFHQRGRGRKANQQK